MGNLLINFETSIVQRNIIYKGLTYQKKMKGTHKENKRIQHKKLNYPK